MSDEQSASQAPQVPVLAIVGVEAWGVAPDGARCQVQIQSATQKIMLAMEFSVLMDLVVTLKAAIKQSQLNAASQNKEPMVQAVQVNRYMVGHAHNVEGALMVIDGELPTEQVYVMRDFQAIELGKLLMAEGQRQRNLAKALDKGIRQDTKPKLILPGRVH